MGLCIFMFVLQCLVIARAMASVPQVDFGVASNERPFQTLPKEAIDSAFHESLTKRQNARKNSGVENSYENELNNRAQSAIPSLMTAALERSTDKQLQRNRCQLPGLQGNVVRSFHNQGSVLMLDDDTSLVELRYDLPEELANETVITGVLYAQLEALTSHKERWLRVGVTVDLEVHEVSPARWEKLVRNWETELGEAEIETTAGVGHQYKPKRRAGDLLRSILARPYAARRFTINHARSHSQATDVLNVTGALGKMRGRRATFVLQSRVNGGSDERNRALCRSPLSPQLVLVSMDRLLCNKTKDSSVGGGFNPFLRRVRRGVRQEQKQRRKHKREDVVVKHTPGGDADGLLSAVCQRRPMWVSFEELGWSDWIIAPRAIQAYRCAGECPYQLGSSLNATNHALVMSLMNSVDPHKSPKACCVPTKLRSVSILYLDSAKNVVLRQYEDMIVESCGCQ